MNGTIDQDLWDLIPEGEVYIFFYAEDKVGNIGIEFIIVIKRLPSEPTIPSFNVILLIGVISTLVAIIIKKQKWDSI